MRDHHIGIEGRAVAQHDRGDDRLAPVRVRNAQDARLADVGVCEQHALDLGGEDALAGAADDLLPAPDDGEEALVVERAEIAGVHPAVALRARGLLGIAPVAAHRELAAGDDLADGAGRNVATLVVHQPHVDVEVWPPDGLGLARDVGRAKHAHGPGLGRAVEDHHVATAKAVPDRVDLRRRHGRRPAAEQPQRARCRSGRESRAARSDAYTVGTA